MEETLLQEIQREAKEAKKKKTKPVYVKNPAPVKKSSWKLKLIIALLVIVAVGSLAYRAFMAGVDYVNTHEFIKNQVITLKSPITIKEKEPQLILSPIVFGSIVDENEPKTKEEKAEIIKDSKYPVILAGVWNLESTNGENPEGHHKYCEQAGYTNEFGFNVYGDNKTCFISYREAVSTVDDWFQKNLKNYSLDEALCLYNSGTASSSCTYQMNYRASEDKVWTDLTK